MAVVVILVLASLGFALVFLAGFIWAVNAGQFEDVETPGLRMLADDPVARAVPRGSPGPSSVTPP